MNRILIFLALVAMTTVRVDAQSKWDQLSDEEKMNELKAFRDANQDYLKNTLKLTPEQMEDLDNTNLCFLSTIDRIDRYGKDEASKQKAAKKLLGYRSTMVEAIMGKEKREQYMAHIEQELQKYME